MSGELRTAPGRPGPDQDPDDGGVPVPALPIPSRVSDDSRIAIEIRSLVEHGDMDEARARFGELVAVHQRRALRIAYQYLRDTSEADEAVQDAFVKVFSHISSYREAWPFEVWFTRILINGCLDRRKARTRRDRWFVPGEISSADEARARPRRAALRPAIRSTACSPASAARRSPRPWTSSMDASAPCSRCATTATTRRARWPR